MPKVLIAKDSGFCFGVRRAQSLLDLAVKNGKEANKKVKMVGPLIHNPRLIKEYEKEGVEVVNVEGVEENSFAVIRSHGIEKLQEETIRKKKGVETINTTCPFVKRIYSLVEEKSKANFGVVVMGDAKHSEVHAVVSRIEGDFLVVSPKNFKEDDELFEFLNTHKKIFLVAQTTSRPDKFEEFVNFLKEQEKSNKIAEFVFENTVCDATFKRQNSAKQMAKEVDCVVVIGGFNSSNTSKLFNIIKDLKQNAFWVESPQNFSKKDLEILKNCKKVGITAGASTPDNQISELKEFIEKL